MTREFPMGRLEDPRVVDEFCSQARRPVFGVSAAPLQDSGKGKVALLYQAVEQAMGSYPVRLQTVGDCVSQAFAGAVDVLASVERVIKGEREVVTHATASEAIYGLARVEVGGRRLGRSDGAYGGWGERAVQQYGTLLRQKYGRYDLTKYSGRKARDWGYKGLPDSLEPTAREHLVRETSLVLSYEEARDAIANGYPVVVCSNQGFTRSRDRDGFARPSGSWPHAMLFCGMDDAHRRPGLLCVNSWGPHWIRGPKRHSQPNGSFWVEADVANRMLRQRDSYSISDFNGYPDRNATVDFMDLNVF